MTSGYPAYPGDQAVREVVLSLDGDAVSLLESLIRIPSLSIPGSDSEELDRSAVAVHAAFANRLPWDFCEVVSAGGGAPALVARKTPSPGFPTVLLYSHHDVQPEGDPGQWDSPPFEPMVRNGRLYGRGSADDGAGIAVHYQALGALNALIPGGGGLGVAVFIEGEEESGSPTFSSLLQTYREYLAADLIIVADSDNPSINIPAVTTSLRGVVGVTITLRTLDAPVHSGLFGGPVPDALTTLIRLLATLHDTNGSVAIDGLDVAGNDASDEDDADLRVEAGLLEGVALWGSGSIRSRLWRKPALTITGVGAPHPDTASNTLLAHASAKISLRIPPGFSADLGASLLEKHLRDHLPTGVQIDFSHWEKGEGFTQDGSHPLADAVEGALRDGFGEEVVKQGLGGSIPFIAELHRVFPNAAISVTGVEDRLSAAHGPNESVDLGMLHRASVSEALLLCRLAAGLAGDTQLTEV